MTFVVTLAAFLLFVGLMAIGVMFAREPLKGSCGGLGKIMGGKCQFCEKKDQCKLKYKKEA